MQVATDLAFTSLSLDTGKQAGDLQQLDTSTTSLPGLAVGATRYWRVQVWNDADVASGWSQPATWIRQPLAALTISSPGATCEETTPPILWAFAGTQARWRVTLSRIELTGPATQLWQAHGADASVAATPDPGLIVTGPTYQAKVEVWDTTARAYDQHSIATQVFTYVRSGVPAAPTGLAVAPLVAGQLPAPAVVLTWSRASAPDFWSLRVNGLEVLTRIPVTDCLVSGSNYRLTYWGLAPRQAAVLEIEAVVQSGGAGAPFDHSGPNPTLSYTPNPVGIWLADDSSPGAAAGSFVCLLGDDATDAVIAENATTYDPVGAQVPVRILDVVRGYEGSISGMLGSSADRDTFLALKALELPVRLVMSDVSIPVVLEAVFARPTPQPAEQRFDCGASFFQCGEPWPVPQ